MGTKDFSKIANSEGMTAEMNDQNRVLEREKRLSK